MKTKHIFITIGAFILGGIIGFTVSTQLQNKKIEQILLNKTPEQSSAFDRYSPDSERNMNRQTRPDINRNNLPPVVANIVKDLELSENQQVEIEKIVRQSNISKSDIEQMRLEKIQPLLSKIYTVLDENQKSKLDDIIAQQAFNSLIN